MIRVAIDAEHTRQTAAGTARASNALIDALRRRDDVEPIVVGGGPLLRRGTLRKRLTTARQDFLWYPYLGRRRAAEAGAQVYHCPTPRAPLSRGKPPLLVTVYDLVSVLFPETMTPWSRLYGSATLKRVLRAADLVTVASEDTANDLTRLMGVNADRIRLVRIGVNDVFFAGPPAQTTIAKPYVLFVGTPEPRKNLPRLVEAMDRLRARGRPHRLVIAGANGWGRVEISSPSVEAIGRVPDSELVSLYANAACLALPSLHEGFGLTALEAMAAGTPVVAGNRGALPEIVGNAAVLVDPYDIESIAGGIEAAIGDTGGLVANGRSRAAQFRWDDAAEEMVRVYRELA